MGGDWNQKKVSQLEDRETTEPDLLEKIAQALKVPVDAIKNFDEEAAVNFVASSFYDHLIGYVKTYTPTFNPIDKLVEVFEENKKLYERLLLAEKEKVEMLDRLLKENK